MEADCGSWVGSGSSISPWGANSLYCRAVTKTGGIPEQQWGWRLALLSVLFACLCPFDPHPTTPCVPLCPPTQAVLSGVTPEWAGSRVLSPPGPVLLPRTVWASLPRPLCFPSPQPSALLHLWPSFQNVFVLFL